MADAKDALHGALQRYWGYDQFRPLQREAMEAVLAHRDSVVVLPTGGGKSLCFQAPAVCLPGLAVVISPLISLMKDQVDTLQACGIAAAYVNSSQTPDERRKTAALARAGDLKLLYVSPERLLGGPMLQFLADLQVSFFAVDEAHCISSWGHDFRPEFRGLRALKESFPQCGVHAYTATASPRVQEDIAEQLGLAAPDYLVGSFDRPNLTYRVRPRAGALKQIVEILDAHPRESGIIYCISRAEVDRTTAALQEKGYRALAYHAGLEDVVRHRHQEAFIADRADIMVATVAFGMGIDKPDVRFVIHMGMPKSLENYQQESGRAGRDGLASECWLFYSSGDVLTWKGMINHDDEGAQQGALDSLHAIARFCTSVTCRHRALVEYFGQTLSHERCGACDVCLDELDTVDDGLVLAQKILSCVLRLRERFGADYTAKVLSGSREQRIVQQGHDQLSTWGLLADIDARQIRDWIEQLVGQACLEKVGEYQTLAVTDAGRLVLRGEETPRLLRARPRRAAKVGSSSSRGRVEPDDDWSTVDKDLFDELRSLRRDQAQQRNVPAYIIFGDAALRDMARRRPTTLEAFREVKGVGDKRCQDFGTLFVDCISRYVRRHQRISD